MSACDGSLPQGQSTGRGDEWADRLWANIPLLGEPASGTLWARSFGRASSSALSASATRFRGGSPPARLSSCAVENVRLGFGHAARVA